MEQSTGYNGTRWGDGGGGVVSGGDGDGGVGVENGKINGRNEIILTD